MIFAGQAGFVSATHPLGPPGGLVAALVAHVVGALVGVARISRLAFADCFYPRHFFNEADEARKIAAAKLAALTDKKKV